MRHNLIIPNKSVEWALQQQVFFIASAPLTGDHVNISPKGCPTTTLSIFDKNTIAYVDATGSGIETIAHIYENGRATIMFCSFDKGPRIMRWYCKGRVVEWDQPEFEVLLKKMGKEPVMSARAVIVFHVWKASSSCGYAVPMVSSTIDPEKVHHGPRAYLEDRKTLGHWANQQVEKGVMEEYRQKMNSRSLDGCAGLRVARRQRGEWILLQDAAIRLRRITRQWEAMLLGALLAVLLFLCLPIGKMQTMLVGRTA